MNIFRLSYTSEKITTVRRYSNYKQGIIHPLERSRTRTIRESLSDNRKAFSGQSFLEPSY